MVRPISLRLRNAEILRRAHAALGRERQEELKRSHNARVLERARGIVAQAREQDRLRRCARLSARKALLLVADAFTKVSASTTSDVDQEHWRKSRELVEAELRKIVERASRR